MTNWYKKTQLDYNLPGNFDSSVLGNCMLAAEIITKDLLNKGIKDFLVVEGYISFKMPSEELGWEEGITHTWIEYNNQIYDPTKEQFKKWNFNPDEIIYEKIKQKYTPEEYLKLCGEYPETNEKNSK